MDKKAIFFAGTSLFLLCPTSAEASDTSSPDQPNSGQGSESRASDTAAADPAEIIVTAQRRTQSLQDVPVSIAAVSAETLDRAAITSVTDLRSSVPGLTAVISQRPGTGTNLNIRGVGTSGSDAGLESAVGFAVDGVFRLRSGSGLGDFVDVERVEVLRGPQGTLLGKNTSAGAISVITHRPVHGFEGSFEATAGNYSLVRMKGVVNVPLSEDRLALRVAAGYHSRDGFIDDPLAGTRHNDRNRWSASAKLLFEPSADLSFLLTADFARHNEDCCQPIRLSNPNAAYVNFLGGLAAARGAEYPTAPSGLVFSKSANGRDIYRGTDRGLSLAIDANLGAAQLVSVTSLRDYRDFQDSDVDFTGADMVRQRMKFRLRSFSQELRLQGEAEGVASGLDWLVGAYYSDDKIDLREFADFGPDFQSYLTFLNPALSGFYPATRDGAGFDAAQSGSSLAFFTHNILSITDRLKLTGGLRYTIDRKHSVLAPVRNFPALPMPFAGSSAFPFRQQYGYDQRLKDNALSGTAVLAYHWTPDINTYASYSRGYKSGGFPFNRDAGGPQFSTNAACAPSGEVAFTPPTVYRCDPQTPEFKRETVDSFELGLRSQLFDRVLTFNLTGFHAKYKNLQLTTFNGVIFNIANAGSATTKGFELETRVTPLNGLSINANVSYTDAKYGKGVPSVATGEPVLGGMQLSNAPRWSGSISADLKVPLATSVELYARPEFFFSTSFPSSTRLGSSGLPIRAAGYELVNATLGVEIDERIDVSAFCRNCFDKRYVALIANTILQSGAKEAFLGNPREFGLTVRSRF